MTILLEQWPLSTRIYHIFSHFFLLGFPYFVLIMPAVGTSFKTHISVRIMITSQTELANGNNFLDSYLLGSKYESTEDSGLLDKEKKN